MYSELSLCQFYYEACKRANLKPQQKKNNFEKAETFLFKHPLSFSQCLHSSQTRLASFEAHATFYCGTMQ